VAAARAADARSLGAVRREAPPRRRVGGGALLRRLGPHRAGKGGGTTVGAWGWGYGGGSKRGARVLWRSNDMHVPSRATRLLSPFPSFFLKPPPRPPPRSAPSCKSC
jgi:hypothetical protein